MDWLILILTMVLIIVFSFIFQLLESAWLKISTDEIVKHEIKNRASANSVLAKRMLRRQPVIVSFLLFLIYVVIYTGSFLLGNLPKPADGWLINTTLIVFPVIAFWGAEIIPKIIGIKSALSYTLRSARLLHWLIYLCRPVTWLIEKTLKRLGGYEEKYQEIDVVATAQAAVEDSNLLPDEAKIIKNFLEIGNQKIENLMISLRQFPHLPSIISQDFALTDSPFILVTDIKDPIVISGNITPFNLLKAVQANKDKKEIDLRPFISGMIDFPAERTVAEVFSAVWKNKIVKVVRGGRAVGILTFENVISAILK